MNEKRHSQDKLGKLFIAGFLFVAGVCHADIVFNFSGTFEACDLECADDPLLDLENTTFSGSLSIPSDAPYREADGENHPFSNDMLWSYYEFAPGETQFSLDTVGTEFDFTDASLTTAIVSFCDTTTCAPNQNFVWFTFADAMYTFSLNFSSPPPNLRSTKIPQADSYEAFFPGFSIHKNDFSVSINTSGIEAGVEFEVLDTDATATRRVPLNSALLAFPIAILGLRKSRA